MSGITLKSLQLEDFKKHENLSIDFSESLTVIRGPNYCGKSTLLKAIFVAMFGPTAVRGRKEGLVRRGKKNFKLTLEVEEGETNAVITRTMTTANVHVDGALQASGHTAVSEWVEGAFGMDMKKLLLLGMSPQSQTSALLTLGAPALNRLVEEVSGADFVERCCVATAKRLSAANAVLTSLGPMVDETALKAGQEAASISAQSADNELQKVELAYAEAKQAQASLRSAYDDAIARNSEGERVRLRRAQISSEEATLAGEIEKLSDECSGYKAPSIELLVKQKEKSDHTLEELTGRSHKLNSLYSQISSIQGWMEKTGDSWEEKAKKIGPKLKKAEKETATLSVKYAELKEKFKTFDEKRAAAEKQVNDSVCHACDRPFDAVSSDKAKKDLTSFEAIVAKLKPELDACKKALAASEATLTSLRTDMPPDGWESVYNAKVEDLDRLAVEYKGIPQIEEGEVAAARALATAAGEALSHARSAVQANEATRAKLKGFQDRIQLLRQELDGLPQSESENLEPLSKELQVADAHVSALSENKTKAVQILGSLKMDLKTAERDLSEAIQGNQKRTAQEKVLTDFGGLQKFLRANKEVFISDIWAGLMALTSEFVTLATSGRVTEVLRDDNGEFFLVEDGEQSAMDGDASGGQNSIAGVGLRLALASLLPCSLGFIVLDEPSSELDEEHAGALAAALRTQGKQVVLVTHSQGEEFVSDKVVILGELT